MKHVIIGDLHGRDVSDGRPVWADYQATCEDALEGYQQVVGHTGMDEATTHYWNGKSVTYLDVLHNKKAYFHEMDI